MRLTDPVCGMSVDPARAPGGTHVHDGVTYAFCNPGCRTAFAKDPQRYLGLRAPEPEPAPPGIAPSGTGAVYTCPMHPEVAQDRPGSCPICGMALEPRTPSLADGPDPELAAMQRRFVVGLVLTVPLLAIAMGGMLPGDPFAGLAGPGARQWLECALATPVVAWCGWPLLVRGWRSLRGLNLNMFTLIALGVSVAYLDSVAATIAPGIFPAAFRGHDGRIGVYFEAAATIVTLVLLGQVLELRARGRTGAGLAGLVVCLLYI
jgi:Cu+-exporting ATPase